MKRSQVSYWEALGTESRLKFSIGVCAVFAAWAFSPEPVQWILRAGLGVAFVLAVTQKWQLGTRVSKVPRWRATASALVATSTAIAGVVGTWLVVGAVLRGDIVTQRLTAGLALVVMMLLLCYLPSLTATAGQGRRPRT